MNFGPRKIVISIAAIPAIRIWPRSIADEATSLASAASGGLIARPCPAGRSARR